MSDDNPTTRFLKSIQPGSPIDKIVGMLYGQALGDAVGLRTEFQFKEDEPDVTFPYTEQVRGFPVCDWTDDTDHMIICAQSMTACKFKFTPTDIAQRLKTWVKTGFAELGDTAGLGCGGTMNLVINHEEFLTNPANAAGDVWVRSGKKLAANGSLMRNCVTGVFQASSECEKWASDMSLISHADSRCVSSCVLHSLLLQGLIYAPIRTHEHIDQLLEHAIAIAKKYIDKETIPVNHEEMRGSKSPVFKTREDEMSHWVRMAYTGRIEELRLDDIGKIGYVFKCLACAIYVLQVIKMALKTRHVPSFKKVMYKISAECGDADTNCAVAGSVLGAYLGYTRLPQDWITAMPHHQWLGDIAVKFIHTLVDRENPANDSSVPADVPADVPVTPQIPMIPPTIEKNTINTTTDAIDLDSIVDNIIDQNHS